MEKKFDKEFIADLACFMDGYNKEIRAHLIEEAPNIAADPMIRKLLHEHRVRVERKNLDLLRDLDLHLNLGCDMHDEEFCLNHSGSYHDVLDDLLVRDWWSKRYDEMKKEEGAA